MLRQYPTYTIDRGPAVPREFQRRETVGSKQKWWIAHRRTGRRVLLKLARQNTGEDWSEKVAFEIAKHLRIPCPRVELAKWNDYWAVLCWDFLRRGESAELLRSGGESLIHGNELLVRRDSTYPAHERYRVSSHTIAAVYESLENVGHSGRARLLQDEMGDGFDMFVGYLLLDALIGNTDRHHENWGLVVSHAQQPRLAPSYDHASSLGRELSDAKREARLGSGGRGTVEDYAGKAISAFWSDSGDKRLSPLEALAAAGALRPRALACWIGRLRRLNADLLVEIVDAVPSQRLSAVGKRFTTELLRYNLQTLTELEA